MSKEVEKESDYSNLPPSAKARFPRIVIFIILTEFCERFSYSGMRAFLTLYLRSKLDYSDDGATEIYHIFSTFVYFFPIIGGILADNYLGKYRTILYMMFVYAAGNILVAVTAIPQVALPARLCTLLGLFMITLGTGGIKPCVTAFGGDQFVLPQQEKYLAIFFSILYFQNCIGSLIAKTVSPILRSEVHCFGDKDCYSLAFGAPGFVVLISIVIFVSARNRYLMKKPEGNVLIDFVKCVALGLKNVVVKGRGTDNSHWLDSTRHQYDQRFIKDIKKTLSLLMLFTVLPVFWALLDQMGSRWTLQATKMDGRFGFLTIKPDQMQVLSPIFCIILIPLSQKYVYPYLAKHNILRNPLHRLTLGGVLAGIAFIASGVLEMYLRTTYPQLPQAGFSQLRIFNGNPCSITIESDDKIIDDNIIQPFYYFVKKDFPTNEFKNITIKLYGDCIEPRELKFLLAEKNAVSYFVTRNNMARFIDNVDKSKSGFPVVRFLISDNVKVSNMTLYNERRNEIETYIYEGVSLQVEVFTSIYSIRVGDEIISNGLEIESGGVYAAIVDKIGDKYESKLIIITEANSITMALLLPQFLIMSIGEVLFGVTGNEFAFKEAPNSMKAVMTAVFLLTEAVGNVLIIIITRLFVCYRQETQYFIYTGLMFVSITLFHFMSRGYQFTDENITKKDVRSNSEALYLQVKQVEDCLDH